MGRAATGTVEFRGTPARWWARVTVRTEDGGTRRVWVDLERLDLKNTPEDKRTAKRLALKRAKVASKKTFVGKAKATAPKVTVDGHPFTAKDILFSFDRIRDLKVDAAHLRSYYQDIEKIEALDDHTVRFHYRIPYFRALEFCGGMPIVPAHLFKEGEDFNQHPIGRKPVGTGPYKLLHWETGKEIALVRNQDYWGEKPALNRIVFKVVTDSTVALQVLKQGGLDAMGLRPIQWEKQTQTKRFDENFRKLAYYLPSFSYIGWNSRPADFLGQKSSAGNDNAC